MKRRDRPIVEKLVKTSGNILTSVLVYITYTPALKKLDEKTESNLHSIQLSGCTIVTINVGLLKIMESPADWSTIGGIGIGSSPFIPFLSIEAWPVLPVVFSGTGSGLAAGKT